MENTSCGEECPFVKTGFCNSDRECPNYSESCWVEGRTGEQKMVKDCIPKRLMIQNNYQQIRLEGLQQAIEQQRNAFLQLGESFGEVIIQIKDLMKDKGIAQVIREKKTLSIKKDSGDSQD